MRANLLVKSFRERGAKPLVNAWMSLPDSYAAELLGHSGVDSVTIDLQHGMMDFSGMLPMLQAVSSTPAMPLVRVPTCDPAMIMKTLDAGAYGIICPQVDDENICREFVDACLYPPLGKRSFGPSRGLLYGGADYVAQADGELLLLAMIESREAVNNLDAILSVSGLSGIYIGPNDLALSYGYTPGRQHPDLEPVIQQILDCALEKGLFTGIFCADEQEARKRSQQGFHLVTPGNDANTLRRAYQRFCAVIHEQQVTGSSGGGY